MGSINTVGNRPDQATQQPTLARTARARDRNGLDFELSLSGRDFATRRRAEVAWQQSELSISQAARERTLEELRTLVRAVQLGETDPESLADLIFYARHPEIADD